MKEEEEVVLRFGLATPKPWMSLGSEQEVEDEMTTESRNKV